MSVAKTALDAIKTRVQAIATGSGYNTSAGSNVHDWPRAIDDTSDALPALAVYDTEDEIDEDSQCAPDIIVNLTVNIDCLIRVDTDPAQEIHDLIEDVKNAVLLADKTLGGAALSVGYDGRSMSWPETPGGIATAQCRFIVSIVEPYGSP